MSFDFLWSEIPVITSFNNGEKGHPEIFVSEIINRTVNDAIYSFQYASVQRRNYDLVPTSQRRSVLNSEAFNAMELPGQQLSAAQALSRLDYMLNLDIKRPPACQRLTGIFCVIGKSCSDVETLEKMIAVGMNVAIINTAFGTRDENIELIKMVRQAAKNYSEVMGKNCPVAVAINLSGRKIRTGRVSDTYGTHVDLKEGEVVRLTSDETYKERCSPYTVYVDFGGFGDQMKRDNRILLDNERIELRVEVISSTTMTCRIERGGLLGSYKDVFIPNVVFDMPNFTENDKLDIEMAIRQQVDIIVAPFVHNSSPIKELKSILGSKAKKTYIVAEIKSVEGYKNFEEILEVANGVIVCRQELGSDVQPKKLILAQKNLIARANKANVPICMRSQLLMSMITKILPLRSELLDISNCILDGVDALMLTAETAVGEHPVECIATMAAACLEAEACVWTKQFFQDLVEKTPIPCDHMTGTAMAGVLAAQRVIAAAIVVVTTSGKSAQIVSKYKPKCPIIAVTRYPLVARYLQLYRGIMPLIYEESPNANWQVDVEARTNFCIEWGMERGFIRVGDPVILVAGWRQGSGFTNTVKVLYASENIVIV